MTDSKQQAPDFEEALKELETLVESMEQGDLTLEQSLASFERGVALTRLCRDALDQAQLKVDKLLENDSDATEPLDPESD
ncbi:MAG: exodeoxyribonuclease VII small subunit [Xanthomonadales bacterium]|nr:exodeoxyribonuclease VII small subunit [Xanthomonadales bacterium]